MRGGTFRIGIVVSFGIALVGCRVAEDCADASCSVDEGTAAGDGDGDPSGDGDGDPSGDGDGDPSGDGDGDPSGDGDGDPSGDGDGDPSGDGDGDPGGCALPARPNASVTGTTPLGPFTGDWALAYLAYGECSLSVGFAIFPAAQEPELAAALANWGGIWTLEPRLEISPQTFDPDTQSWVGTGSGTVAIALDQSWAQIDGPAVSVTVTSGTPFADDWSGSFTVVGDGWDLSGSFTPIYCDNQDLLCP